MTDYYNDPSGRYRVWIASYEDWKPQSCRDIPPDALALEPAENSPMSARQAARYVEAFNRAALAERRKIWAVAVPVAVRYDGEPRLGQSLARILPSAAEPQPKEEGSGFRVQHLDSSFGSSD